jgi:hypothetical protein
MECLGGCFVEPCEYSIRGETEYRDPIEGQFKDIDFHIYNKYGSHKMFEALLNFLAK